jgi:DNA (cytosine-5)-methyltransferase 1
MKYLSVCSGIEAATVAWHPLGWQAAAYSEIEPFPSAVLAHHYPDVANVGDMTKFKEWSIESGSIDLLVGGTPCQSFSVAGLRKGLADPRGNLALVYCGILDHFKPRWFVWENVPGVLSSGGGRDFGSFLGAVAELGYGFAYRVLDAQYFGVAQRRRRVFVVGHLGDWRPAAKVLFERESLRGDPAPSRKARETTTHSTAPCLTSSGRGVERTGDTRGQDPVVAVCPTLRAGGNRTGGDRPPGTDVDTADSLIVQPYPVANTLTARMHKGINSTVDEGQTPVVTHSLRGEGFDASEDGTGRGTQLVSVAFAQNQRDEVRLMEIAGALAAEPGAKQQTYLHQAMQVRRLTPVECERLQGFPDNYTAIPWRKKPIEDCPDGPRYKALGNSMAVPVMAWIGKRINELEA